MEKKDIEDLREKVSCAALLEKRGWTIDVKESTRRAVKFRRADGEITIVIHQGRGWFDPLSDAKGDVFLLAQHLDHVGFGEALTRVAEIVGFVPTEPAWERPERKPVADLSVAERWRARRAPWPGSATWRYLRDERRISDAIIRAAVRHGGLREGPQGSMWAAHVDETGAVTGWEERGAQWRGFSTGGAKVLFRLGDASARRLCVTEAAIDAMSLAAIDGLREGSLYLSTGGGWSPVTEAAVRALAAQPGAQLVAATDNNAQGEAFAGRLRAIAEAAGCDSLRLTPPADDWNEALKVRAMEEGEERRRGPKTAAACPPAASRVTLRPAAPALDPAGLRCGRAGRVRNG